MIGEGARVGGRGRDEDNAGAGRGELADAVAHGGEGLDGDVDEGLVQDDGEGGGRGEGEGELDRAHLGVAERAGLTREERA
jgi:hypothetical protein